MIGYSCKNRTKETILTNEEARPIEKVLQLTDSIGIGLLIIKIDEGGNIPLYLNKQDENPFDTLRFVEKQFNGKTALDVESTQLQKDFSPYRLLCGEASVRIMETNEIGVEHHPAYQLALRVVSKNDNCYGIIINEQKGEVVYVKREDTAIIHKFNRSYGHQEDYCISWADYLTSIEGIYHKGKIYDKPNEKDSTNIKNSNNEYFVGITVQGQWLQIAKLISYPAKPIGWIKWTDGKSLQIMPIEYFTE
jgi:hypothetical protein